MEHLKGATLVTGASGFIGKRLIQELAGSRPVVALSRRKPEPLPAGVPWVQGSFDSFEDLRQLDRHDIRAAVHLGAVTGGCSEEDGLAVNVQGTRRLLRYLMDRGTRSFVLASSIAAVGCLTGGEPRFKPLHLPMRPDHPNVGRDAYGLSKAMMEEVAGFFARSYPDAGFVNLRFGAVSDEATHQPAPLAGATLPAWGFVLLGRVALSDVVRGVTMALDALAAGEPRGFRSYNLVGPDNGSDEGVPAMMRVLYGPDAGGLDLSHYARPGREHAPLWSMEEFERELGFVPRVPFAPAKFAAWKDQR